MEVLNYVDSEKKQFREIIDSNYKSLSELKEAYEDRGCKAWLNLWDCTKAKGLLSGLNSFISSSHPNRTHKQQQLKTTQKTTNCWK